MKLGLKEYSGVQILNSRISSSNSVPRITFFLANLVLKYQSAFFEMKLGTKGYLVVLISRSTIVFGGNCGPETLKFYILNKTQYSEIFKSANSGWIQFFYTIFF